MRLYSIILFLFASGCTNLTTAQYPFIRHDLNRLILPNDSSSWIKFTEKLNEAKNKGTLRILHFGDSHIQGDYFTGEVRRNLVHYLDLNIASRGITLPYKLAGTNGPDELFSQSQGYMKNSSVRKGGSGYYALTGYKIIACDTFFKINLKDTSNYKFNKVFVFHSTIQKQTIKINNLVAIKTVSLSDSLQVSEFILPELQTELFFEVFNSSDKKRFALYAFSLENSDNTVNYSSIGINGATYGTFLNLQDSKNIISFLKPDCVILSYGTNDALNSRLDTIQFKNQIINCINVIRGTLPDIPIILTTPGDYLVAQKVNPRTALVARLIKNTALANNCACWDFYNIMGGTGSVMDWYRNQLVFKDYIHLSKKGYKLQGDLFFAALLKLKDLSNNYR